MIRIPRLIEDNLFKPETHSSIGVDTGVGIVSTGAHSVDVELGNGGPDGRIEMSSNASQSHSKSIMHSPDHGHGSTSETGGNPPDGGETDTVLSQEGVDTEIEDRDEDLK